MLYLSSPLQLLAINYFASQSYLQTPFPRSTFPAVTSAFVSSLLNSDRGLQFKRGSALRRDLRPQSLLHTRSQTPLWDMVQHCKAAVIAHTQSPDFKGKMPCSQLLTQTTQVRRSPATRGLHQAAHLVTQPDGLMGIQQPEATLPRESEWGWSSAWFQTLHT